MDMWIWLGLLGYLYCVVSEKGMHLVFPGIDDALYSRMGKEMILSVDSIYYLNLAFYVAFRVVSCHDHSIYRLLY